MSAKPEADEQERIQDSEVRFRVENVRKEFNNVVALDDIDFELRRGEVVGLVGENGAGKSTLLNILSGIYQQNRGNIYVDDEEVIIENPRDASHEDCYCPSRTERDSEPHGIRESVSGAIS
ncbi:ATP-binding cassette domain-containing protein [Halopenitus salinus]|uniref:ATP-binding cassette domain-containing protein n=1 Tax=Halopenitus salinus TaxID=1198295 RepID=UPI0036137B3A